MAWKKNKKAAEEEVTSTADPNPENNEAIFGNLWNNEENNEEPVEEQSAPEESSDEEFQLPDDGSIQIAYDADGNGYYISYDQETDQYFDPYSGDVYDINSMYDAEGNPFKFFATEELPEESSSESPAEEAPASEPLYEDSSIESSTPAEDLSASNDAASDNVVNSIDEKSSTSESPQTSDQSSTVSQTETPPQDQLQTEVEPQEINSESQPSVSSFESDNLPPVKEDLQVSQSPEEEITPDNNLSEQTTLPGQQPSEFSLNSNPSEPNLSSDKPTELSSNYDNSFNVNEKPLSESLSSSNEFEIKTETPSEDSIKAAPKTELAIDNNFKQDSLPNLTPKSELQSEQPLPSVNVNPVPEVQTSSDFLTPQVTVQSEITQEITEPVYDSYESNSYQSNFASPSIQSNQTQQNIPSNNIISPVVTDNYQQPTPANNIFIPSPQPAAFNEQVLSSLPSVQQSYSNFIPTPEVSKPNSSFSVVENSAADNIFANKLNSTSSTQTQQDLNIDVREEPTTEIFLDSVNEEISQITNEPKTDYSHPLPISAVLNPPLSFEQNSKEENESNKIHYIAYETPKVKNSFWSKYVGNEKYGHLDESGKWVWDGYFYDNEEFVPNKADDNEAAEALSAINESIQDDDDFNYEEEFKLDTISSDEDDNEEIIPVSCSESSDTVKTYTNSEYDSDIKILSDEQATKLISDSSLDNDSINVIEHDQVELISEDSKNSKEAFELTKDEQITVEEILPQKTSMPDKDIASQNYKVIEEEKEIEVVEEDLASNLEEPLPKPNNLSTFKEPTNELEQLTSEIVSGDQTEISEDSLFKTDKYDEEVKKSFASTLDFLVKSKQEANTVYKKISKELRSEIESLTKNIEKLKIEFKDNEGRIRSQKSEIMRSLSNDFNPGNNYTSGRDFDNLQHAQDYNKHLLQTIKDNETRLVVLISNQKQLKVVYENRIIKINSDINKMQKIISNVNSSNYNINLLGNNQSIINDNNNYQNQVNSFLPTPMNNYLTNPGNSLVPFENTVGIYNSGNDLLFDNDNISNILNDYQERPLLSSTGLIQNQSPFNLSDSIFNKKPFDFDSNFSDSLNSLDGYKSNYFDDDFETLVPDRTSSLDDLLGSSNKFITGTDELFDDNYDTKVSFTDDLENILSK